MTGLEPVRRSTHAPQTCLSTSSSTLALISRGEPLVSQRQDILYQGHPPLSTKFAKKIEKFSNAENYYQNRRKSTLSRAFSSAFGGMKNCRPSGNSVGWQKFFYFFAEMLQQAPHALCPNPPIPPYGAGAEIWAVGFLFCGEQLLNILEVVGLRAPTAVAECHRHSAKSRPSLRMKRALRSGRWDSICCGKQPLNILEVVGLRAPTAVETCHWHVSKSRPSLRMERALRSGRWDSICCGKCHGG